ncbi:hypothetical protein C8R45DRAFT_1110508 [Mycena sanguinolenta]|nr:hypothetical protein C8R45DRAFT_1110508 [Mycena sanguinolenta]
MPTTIALEQLKTALDIVAALSAGAINVPVLQGVACAAIKIIEIVQTVTKNNEDAVDLARNAAERTSSLLHAFKGKSKGDIPLELQQDIARYAQKLELIQKVLIKHRAQTRLRGLLSSASNREEINKCKDILTESFQVFETSLTLRLHTRLPELLGQLQSQIIAQIKPALDIRGSLRSILRANATPFVPRAFTLRADAAAFTPRSLGSTLRADTPVFSPRKFRLRALAPAFVPGNCTPAQSSDAPQSPNFTLRADAPVFSPRKLTPSLRPDAPVFVPA